MNGSTFIGTKLPDAEFRQFSIKAAERGTSKSGLLRTLALEFLASEAAPIRKVATRRRLEKKEVA
jgi:hypothetical protein